MPDRSDDVDAPPPLYTQLDDMIRSSCAHENVRKSCGDVVYGHLLLRFVGGVADKYADALLQTATQLHIALAGPCGSDQRQDAALTADIVIQFYSLDIAFYLRILDRLKQPPAAS